MAVSRVHHCISQEMVAQGFDEPPARRCRCRKFVTLVEATLMVKLGEAKWAVVARKRVPVEKACPLCHGSDDVMNCANECKDGKVEVFEEIDSYNNDIVRVSRAAVNKKERKYRPWLAMKTPRVATIEAKHIVRAYHDGVKEAQERIEEYGRLDREMIADLIVGFEPEDNPEKGTGRRYDFGRSV